MGEGGADEKEMQGGVREVLGSVIMIEMPVKGNYDGGGS